jgi:hypothetical protein
VRGAGAEKKKHWDGLKLAVLLALLRAKKIDLNLNDAAFLHALV